MPGKGKKGLTPATGEAKTPKRRTGRPTKLTKEVAEEIVNSIHSGCFVSTAAAAAGIDVGTLNNWLALGKADLGQKRRTVAAEFKLSYDAATAQCEKLCLQIVKKAADSGVHQAAMWLLERRFPDRWAKRQVLAVSRDDGVMTSAMMNLQNFTDTELAQLRALLEKGTKKQKVTAATDSKEVH